MRQDIEQLINDNNTILSKIEKEDYQLLIKPINTTLSFFKDVKLERLVQLINYDLRNTNQRLNQSSQMNFPKSKSQEIKNSK
jgi:hypothetical protein